MTRREFKEYIDKNYESNYVCKIKGDKRVLRYHINLCNGGYYLLVVDYSQNNMSMTFMRNWPNESMEDKFRDLYVHNLTELDLDSIFIMFTK